ncbi:type II toxin-antitoxin system VapC family toxin [Rhodoferax antarcticus]|uniref:type II toxin-antitoxin system VapC family toxin n=1 Tax=Rhodoferax antarcticus TaxID=81479 RepID=UPI0018EA223C|nr:type II toxin-antitoxin system VapC family toxin [Rhodoferax antarcticus]MCW2313908.1 putative nucleic acid-binding protein [Rhodoferax antarcticus]
MAILAQENSEALVPSIWTLEAANVMLKAQGKTLVTEARCAAFAGLLQDMDIATDPLTATYAVGDTLQLARRFKLSSCDASYLELGLRDGLPLATLDGDLRSAMLQTGVALA